MKEDTQPSASECEFLIGDDTCSTVKESAAGVLRVDACKNAIKDKCCYLCSLRTNCEIGCDLLEQEGAGKKPKEPQPSNVEKITDYGGRARCGNCVYYLKVKCPRGYSHDAELWRRQDPCGIFNPA